MERFRDFSDDEPAINEQLLHTVFADVKDRMGSFYECRKDLSQLGLRLDNESHDHILPRVANGNLCVSLSQVDALHQELADAWPQVTAEGAFRVIFGVGVAGVIAQHRLARVAADGDYQTRAMQLGEFFASHEPIREAFESVFTGKFAERAIVADEMSDDRAMEINGIRYRLKLLQDVYAESEDYDTLPNLDLLGANARKRMFEAYSQYGGIYTDVSVSALGLSAVEGDKMFFQTLSPWLIAFASPMTTSEIEQIDPHSDA